MKGIQPIRRLAIVNRGEAAMRCIRAVKTLRACEGSSIEVIALYTQVDRNAPFVRHADLAVPLVARAGSEVAAYLNHDGLIETLRRANADAVWPGWGFVAEDANFVEKLERAGIRFLGPTPDAMRRLGDKISSKLIAEAAAVPVTPWSQGVVEDEARAQAIAHELGYPVVIKASAGGGGRGIRIVDDPARLAELFRSAASEARNAFGDDRLFLECKVSGGRHIEVQIVADAHGNVFAVGCRDCSVQRRHQKVLEEAPPPDLAPERIEQLKRDAVRIAREVAYRGVGTVEFLVSAQAYAFLEMNPRLQVEHGITEALTGLDLVELQIRIARGESLADLAWEEQGAAIEARVCAEDPDAGFLPAPGRIARFDPALGPKLRIDTGVTADSVVPSAFDSLIAKVIARGATREEARARLACALLDFDLVIVGGATNKGFLLDVLDSEDFRRGGVDTEWLDRYCADYGEQRAFAVEALVTAGILSYQRARQTARRNVFSDTANFSTDRLPPSRGQQIDLSCRGESYRLEIYAMGSWQYRVYCDDRVIAATLREEGQHIALLDIGEHAHRIVYDISDSGVRVEIEGHPHHFSNQSAGQVRSGTPAMVVAIHVQPGDRVEAGQALGVLEAMKTEIGFEAPVSGVVTEVFVRRGQQVAAGEALLVIDPASDREESAHSARLQLFEVPDPLAPLFVDDRPDLQHAQELARGVRRSAMFAVRSEVRRVLLGYDVNEARAQHLATFLEAKLPDDLAADFQHELAEIRYEVAAFADLEQLFSRAPSTTPDGQPGPSNNARMRMFVRRIRAGGAGIDEDFLQLVRNALVHYGVASLQHSDAIERAVLRMLASQQVSSLRQQLLLAVLRRLAALVARGVDLLADKELESALERIARLRGLVSDALADAAADAVYTIFERPRVESSAERISLELAQWLREAERQRPSAPPEAILAHLADAPRNSFDRVGNWLGSSDPHRRTIASLAWLRRVYSPRAPLRQAPSLAIDGGYDRYEFAEGESVFCAACTPESIGSEVTRLLALASQETAVDVAPCSIELFVPVPEDCDDEALLAPLATLGADCASGTRLTLGLVPEDGETHFHTFVVGAEGLRPRRDLHGIHPEIARRIGLDRLRHFDLERIPAGENIYCFHGRSLQQSADERIFVLADARNRSLDERRDAAFFVPAFEHIFYEATRALRTNLRMRDPKRRLHWNRISIVVTPAIELDPALALQLSRRLAPATRNLGLEKVCVRIDRIDSAHRDQAPQAAEFVISDITGSNMEIQLREPHTEPLEPSSDYERRIVEARRRRLVYPYEIIRMLTAGGPGSSPTSVSDGWELPVGRFEEYDLAEGESQPRAVPVAERPYGRNASSIVFGVIDTPTEKVPEGMKRVLILSDPTQGMGSLAAPECDRICAALDLADRLRVPVEWLPVSSGARIAMDSGTENLDATARVVRRIVQFTQAGGSIHLIVSGVNVGAQSYWDALATMLMHTRGALIMTPRASMVLTGRAALEASGGVAAEDEAAIGGFERIMGPNGEAQYFATDLVDAYRILYEHYRYTYVAPGESRPRPQSTQDTRARDIGDQPIPVEIAEGFKHVGEIFDAETNPGRKRPFPMRAVMQAVIDRDGGALERWRAMVGAETAIVWDAHLGGYPVCLIGIESRNLPREGYRPLDGPSTWNAGTLFPLSSKKVARAINAASGNRPVVVLANLSGFDGSPESMRKLQLEYGAEIARAVVNFEGPILFLVVSRYHGGAYVVFSQELNPRLEAAALEGSYASVIGGGPAAAVVFSREVRVRALADPSVAELERRARRSGSPELRERFEEALEQAILEQQARVAAEFDAIHSVERAREVGSLEQIIPPHAMRSYLIGAIERFGDPDGSA